MKSQPRTPRSSSGRSAAPGLPPVKKAGARMARKGQPKSPEASRANGGGKKLEAAGRPANGSARSAPKKETPAKTTAGIRPARGAKVTSRKSAGETPGGKILVAKALVANSASKASARATGKTGAAPSKAKAVRGRTGAEMPVGSGNGKSTPPSAGGAAQFNVIAADSTGQRLQGVANGFTNGHGAHGDRPHKLNGSRKVMSKVSIAELPPDYRPSDQEPFMGDLQRLYFRRKLAAWRDEILRSTKETLQSLHEDQAHYADIADRATSESDKALELRARDRQRKLIAKIEAAMERIERGTYGYCDETGEPIAVKRLDARPIATLSIEAQERHERRERVYRDD